MLQKLQATDWSPVLAENDINIAIDKFIVSSLKSSRIAFPLYG